MQKSKLPPPGKKGQDKKDDNQNGQLNWRGAGKSMLFWVALVLIVIVAFNYFQGITADEVEISYTEFLTQLESDNVSEVSFTDRNINGKLNNSATFASSESTKAYSKFKTLIPFPDINYDLINRLEAKNVAINVKEKTPDLFSVLLTLAPWILIIFIWLFFIRQMQSGGGPRGLFSFGKSKAKPTREMNRRSPVHHRRR